MKFCKHLKMCTRYNFSQKPKPRMLMRCKCPFYEEEDEDHEDKVHLNILINDKITDYVKEHGVFDKDLTGVMTKAELQKLKRMLEG